MIRRASPADRDGVVRTVSAAFAGDPAWGFLMGEDYEWLAPHFAGTLFDLRAVSGNVWVSDDLATVAMWETPGTGDGLPQRAREVWARYVAVAGEPAHERLIAYRSALAAVAPGDRYWYLGVLATYPDRQREGLASAVLMPVLEEADRRGLPCCLETSTEANRRFYGRRGFTDPTEVVLPGGPPTWWLRREPSAAERSAADGSGGE